MRLERSLGHQMKREGELEHALPDWSRIWAACSGRIHYWRRSPRWTLDDWLEEIDAECMAAACLAIRIFDKTRGPTLSSFVYHRMLATLGELPPGMGYATLREKLSSWRSYYDGANGRSLCGSGRRRSAQAFNVSSTR